MQVIEDESYIMDQEPHMDYNRQLEEIMVQELERAKPTNLTNSSSKKKKVKSLKLKKSFEKLTSKLKLNSREVPPTDTFNCLSTDTDNQSSIGEDGTAGTMTLQQSLNQIENTHLSLTTSDTNFSLKTYQCTELDDLENYNFQIKKMTLDTNYLKNQNLGLIQELEFSNKTLDSLRLILSQKLELLNNIEQYKSSSGSSRLKKSMFKNF